jgi:hypothetical protein
MSSIAYIALGNIFSPKLTRPNAGIFQRTAAMVWIYLNNLKHVLGRTLFIGAGKVARHTAKFIKYFNPDVDIVDYQDVEQKTSDFENQLHEMGIEARYLEDADFSG